MLNRSLLPLIVGLSASLIVACSGDERTGGGTTPRKPTDCGNGTLNSGEQCDDGNKIAGDGCSATCQSEMVSALCGNGAVDAGEQCDDGNTAAGDGCSATCQSEMVSALCGNGTLDAGEACDDGNTAAGDGCSATCQTENTASICGNGVIEGSEQCDDGNTTSGDGCSSTCQGEMGAVCGDGTREGAEQCDDGNTTSGDGCSSTCQTETMMATCQAACDHVLACGEMQCPGTYDIAGCLGACNPDPAAFMTDAVLGLSCAEINAQICVTTQETDAGDACISDMDCEAGILQAQCIPENDMGTPTGYVDGYCIALGCNGDAACGIDNLCVTVDQMGTTACFAGCTPANNGAGVCRNGYQCLDLSMGVGICIPVCVTDMDCGGGTSCNTMTGQCT